MSAQHPRETVSGYFAATYPVVIWKADGDCKGPKEAGWPNKTYTLADYQDGDRVGLLTGTEIAPGKYLHDVDMDWAAGSLIAQALLPSTAFVFGRQSKKVSHCFYLLDEPVRSMRYEDVDKTCLIELRGTKADGTIGLQTMCPPSLWSKGSQRELLTFLGALNGNNPTPASATASVLRRRVCLAAIGMILAKHLGKNGFGHEPRLAWAGFLLRLDLTVDELVEMGEAMSVYCNNREVHDIRRVLESTATSLLTEGKKVKGGPALAKIIGDNGKAVVGRIREWLGCEDDATTVVMLGGKLSSIVDRSVDALRERGTPIYVRGGVLTRPIRLDASIGDESGSIRRDAGSVVLQAVREAWLTEEMGRVLTWKRQNREEELKLADPAPIYARTLLARGEWPFPALRAILRAPTLDRDGRIIELPGFDLQSGLLLDFPPGTFPHIPAQPNEDEARLGLDLLLYPLREFPFVNDAARSVALSALLTALVRPSLRTTPLHAFDAPTAGTGKSLLAEGVGLLSVGCRPPALSQGKTPEEDEKRLSTVLFAGDPTILVDNCERPIQGDFLCSMLTQEVVQARILGQSERRVLPCVALVLATGNNLQFAGDVSRRVVVCRLDAQVERPDARVFAFDFHEELSASRPELVVAGLTILRAYHVAGRPVTLTPMGSFADWDWVRGALVWLGCADPADTRAEIIANDPKRDELVRVMDLWAQAFGSESLEVGDIAKLETPQGLDLMNALIEACCRGGVWNAKSVGWWLKRHKDRVVGGRSFCSKSGDRQQWTLVGGGIATGSETDHVHPF